MSKTTGTIGRVYKQTTTDKNGNEVKQVRIYFTQDAVIKQGQIAFCDDIEEDYLALERLGKLGDEKASVKIDELRRQDNENNRETLFRVKLGKAPEAGNNGTGDKL